MQPISKKLKLIIPFLVLFILFGILWRELFYSKHNELPSALIGKALPNFKLPNLDNPKQFLTQKDFIGHMSLLNIWASWCNVCAYEQQTLMRISEEYGIPIYGINYKDNPSDASEWLDRYGNPFVMVGQDQSGDVAIDLGVYGTPETYLVNAEGKIIYRHVGMLDQKTWDDEIYPLILKKQT